MRTPTVGGGPGGGGSVVACGHTTDFYVLDFPTLFVYRSPRVSIQSSYFFF